ncbi:hypothetical protein EGW08_019277, partial [Elysia chlorotica]
MSQSYCGPNNNSSNNNQDRNASDGIETLFEGQDGDAELPPVEMRPRTNSATAIELGSRTPGRIAMGMASARIRRSYASPVKEQYHLPARPASHSLVSPAGQARHPGHDVQNLPQHQSDSRVSDGPTQSVAASLGVRSPSVARRVLLHRLPSPSQAHKHPASSSTPYASQASTPHIKETAGMSHLQQHISKSPGPKGHHTQTGQKQPISSGSKGHHTQGGQNPQVSRIAGSDTNIAIEKGTGGRLASPLTLSHQTSQQSDHHQEKVWELRPEFRHLDSAEEAGPRSLDENLLFSGVSRSTGIEIPGRDSLSAISPIPADGRSSPYGDLGFALRAQRGSRDWNLPRQRHSLDSGQRYLSQSVELSPYHYHHHHQGRRPTVHGSSSFYAGLPHHYPPRYYQHQHPTELEQMTVYDQHRLIPDEDQVSLGSGMEQGFHASRSGYPNPSHVTEGMSNPTTSSYHSDIQPPDGAPHRSLQGPHLHAMSPMSRASISLAPLPEEQQHNLSAISGDSLSDLRDLRYGSASSLALSSSVPCESSGFPPHHRRYRVVPNYPGDLRQPFHHGGAASTSIWASGERWNQPGPQSLFSRTATGSASSSSHLRHQRSSSIHSIPTLETRHGLDLAAQAVYSYDDNSLSRPVHNYSSNININNYNYHNFHHPDHLYPPEYQQYHPSQGFPGENAIAPVDVRARSQSLVSAPGSDIAARLGGFASGRHLDPYDRAWSYSVTSLVESGSGSTVGLLASEDAPRAGMESPDAPGGADLCPACHRPFDSGRKRRLIDTCGHERCYTCMFNSEMCPVCVAQAALHRDAPRPLVDPAGYTAHRPKLKTNGHLTSEMKGRQGDRPGEIPELPPPRGSSSSPAPPPGSYKVAPPVPAKPKYMHPASSSRTGAPPIIPPTSLANQGPAFAPHPQYDSLSHTYYGSDSASSAPGLPRVGGAYPVGGATTMENMPSQQPATSIDRGGDKDSPPPPPPDVAQTDLMMRLGLLLGDRVPPGG